MSFAGQHALSTKQLVTLSEQNLVDCTKQEGNFGCGGGWPFDSYEYIIRFSSGLDTEEAYPYKGVDQTCAYDPTKVGATATGKFHLESVKRIRILYLLDSIRSVAT